ncbi:MAG: TetR/AcrR family transcriptional regulator [Pseudomonadota bacterium]
MPTSTYHNLGTEKRDRLLRAAIIEFAEHDYASAKLDRIAARSKIPKGSFYQYFRGKEALYVHVVKHALDLTWEHFQRHSRRQRLRDCFELLEASTLHMFTLAKRHPELAAIYARVVYEPDTHLQSRLYPTYRAYSDEFHARFLTWGLATGDIDRQISPALIRFQVHALGTQWNRMILTGDWPPWMPAEERRRRQLVRQSIDRLRVGLGATDSGQLRVGA